MPWSDPAAHVYLKMFPDQAPRLTVTRQTSPSYKLRENGPMHMVKPTAIRAIGLK